MWFSSEQLNFRSLQPWYESNSKFKISCDAEDELEVTKFAVQVDSAILPTRP